MKEFSYQHNIGMEKVDDIWWSLCKSNPPKMSKIAKLDDCVFLYQVITHFKPKVIVEIGTWIGTTAYVMSQAQMDCDIDGRIYTCDQHKQFTYWDEYDNIKYYNVWSYDFLKKIKEPIDFVFADGRLFEKDCKKLAKMYRGKKVFVTHDKGLRKGKNNLKYMLPLMNDVKVYEHGESALVYEYKKNHC